MKAISIVVLTLSLVGSLSESAIAKSKPIKGCFPGAKYTRIVDGKQVCSRNPIGQGGTADGGSRKFSK